MLRLTVALLLVLAPAFAAHAAHQPIRECGGPVAYDCWHAHGDTEVYCRAFAEAGAHHHDARGCLHAPLSPV